ncbi:MAG TPA: lysylphosphatidylglycerol synthase transmembrane domain-containing protein [Verrucomicrobiae bacterium]|nr:lysylphosphatidylglycerol synthase transmembrane domain-containing protein [Verrucomicrobiae bacterium]
MPQLAAAEPPDAPAPSGRRTWGRSAAALAVGALILTLFIYYSDLETVQEYMGRLGWTAPLVLLPYLIINIFDTLGWRCTLPPAVAGRVPFVSLYLTRMAGEALNSLTVAVGGEPVKAHLLRPFGVSGSDGLASVVIAKTALTASQIVLVLLGIGALFDRLERRALGAVWLALLLVAAIGFVMLMVRMQRRGPVITVWGWLHRLAPRAVFVARLEARAQAIDDRLADFYRIEGRAFRRATVFHLIGWLLGIVELWAIMWLIGSPIAWRDALIIEALAQPIRATSLVIPGGLGTQEVGGVALCTFLGMTEGVAATLWLLRRGREFAFDGVGLVYLMRRTAAQG